MAKNEAARHEDTGPTPAAYALYARELTRAVLAYLEGVAFATAVRVRERLQPPRRPAPASRADVAVEAGARAGFDAVLVAPVENDGGQL